MLHYHKALVCCALALAGAGAPTLADDIVFDTTLGTFMSYEGDLDAGVLNMSDFDGSSFRVQRLDQQTQFGTFGTGGAALDLQVELFGFSDLGDPGYGQGDVAAFRGLPDRDFDFMLADEYGETISGSIGLLELSDRSDGLVLPGVEGQALLSDLVFSGDTFQGLPVNGNLDSGTLYVFVEAANNWDTLGQLLAEGGAGPQLTLEIQFVPAPAATTPLLLGMFGYATRRRRA
jgi:hypothetical protein